MKMETLQKVEEGTLSPRTAYKNLYQKRNAAFYKMRIDIKESKAVSLFLNVLFFLPTPVFLLRLINNIAFKDIDQNARKLMNKSLRNRATKLSVSTSEATIKINAL